MINCGLRTDAVSRDEEEPKLGRAGTPKPGLPTLCRLHRAVRTGQGAAGQPTRARGKGDGQRGFLSHWREKAAVVHRFGPSGKTSWFLPTPSPGQFPQREHEARQTVLGTGELCRVGSAHLCSPLPCSLRQFPPHLSVSSHQAQHVLGPSFHQPGTPSSTVWVGTCKTVSVCPGLRGQTRNSRGV